MEISQNKSCTNFKGLLYCQMGTHKTKGIFCCSHGDAKFVKYINKLAQEGLKDKVSIDFDNNGLKKILINTKDFPNINWFEKIFFNLEKLQKKAIKKIEHKKMQSFTYKINELEFYTLSKDYWFISNKQINKFIQNIKSITPPEKQDFINSFFNYKINYKKTAKH